MWLDNDMTSTQTTTTTATQAITTPTEEVTMSHSLDTIVTVTEHPATEDGALDGFQAECHTCGAKASFSIRSMTNKWAHDHRVLMTKWGK